MNIVSGQLRGLPLRAPAGMTTRPTAVRSRKALFDSLGDLSGKSLDELKANFNGEGDADWLLCPWDGTPEEEETLAKSLRISIRCIPQGEMGCAAEAAPCILTGRPTTRRVLWARAY